jgi:replicative DNA helicase
MNYRMVVTFPNGETPVASAKHLSKWRGYNGARRPRRTVNEVVEIGKLQCQCIRTTAPDGLYVTDHFVVTHNTTCLLQWAEFIAIDAPEPATILFIEPEMSPESLFTRLLCSRARVDSRRYNTGLLTSWEWEVVNKAAAELSSRIDFGANRPVNLGPLDRGPGPRFRVVSKYGMTVQQIRSLARRIKRKRGLSAIFVDGLSLLSPGKSTGNNEQDLGNIAYGLKGIASDLQCPLFFGHQVNEDVKLRKNREPQLGDERGSKQIGHAADIMAFLWSPSYHLEKEAGTPPPDAEAVYLKVAKHRGGPCGQIELSMLRRYTRFEDLDPTPPDGPTGF